MIVRGAPGRGSSVSPSRRWATNRERHLPTVGRVIPSRRATSVLLAPDAHSSTIRDRSANCCELFGLRAHRANVSLSSSVSTSPTFGRPRSAISEYFRTTTEFAYKPDQSRPQQLGNESAA